MRIAILSALDFKTPGGAERFFIDLALALDATIVCLSFDETLCKLYPAAKEVRFLPLNKKLPKEPLRQIAGMLLFKRLKLDFDFFIATDDMTLRYLSKENPNLYLMLTPRRALYDMNYIILSEKSFIIREIYSLILSFFRLLDRHYVNKNVQNIAGISHNVRNRIWKYYGRTAKVLYPPIFLNKYHFLECGDFYLCVSRVDKWKRIELIVEAFREMPDKKLIIAGKIYPSYQDLVKNSPENVRFTGSISDDELQTLYATCRGFITMAIDEDYGLTPLEAMASGKAVIAACEGGYMETVVDGYTGYLISPEVNEIKNALLKVDASPDIFREASQKRVTSFDYYLFKEEVNNYVKSIL